MNTSDSKSLQLDVDPPRDQRESLDDGEWFVNRAKGSRTATVRPKSSPPTGDAEIDGWLQ